MPDYKALITSLLECWDEVSESLRDEMEHLLQTLEGAVSTTRPAVEDLLKIAWEAAEKAEERTASRRRPSRPPANLQRTPQVLVHRTRHYHRRGIA